MIQSRLIALIVGGGVALLASAAFLVGMVNGLYNSRSKREAEIATVAHAHGRAEAAAEQAAELARLAAETKAAQQAAVAARIEARDAIAEVERASARKFEEALRRARGAAGGDCLARPVPDGLRLGPATGAGVRRPAGEGADPGGDA